MTDAIFMIRAGCAGWDFPTPESVVPRRSAVTGERIAYALCGDLNAVTRSA